MTVDTKEVVTTIAYMIGVRMSALTVSYGECSELIEKLQADKDATTIRIISSSLKNGDLPLSKRIAVQRSICRSLQGSSMKISTNALNYSTIG